jgi:hypothetical protein
VFKFSYFMYFMLQEHRKILCHVKCSDVAVVACRMIFKRNWVIMI